MDILNQFGINPLLLAAQVVNFLILLFILKKFLYKPILKVLAQRKETIAQSLKNAEEIEKKLNDISARESEALMKSAKEGEKIIKQATDEAVAIIEEGKKKYQEIIERASQDSKRLAEGERIKLQEEIKLSLSDFIILALQKVLGKTVDEKKQKEMIDETIKDLKV